jgi:hypothetical protein
LSFRVDRISHEEFLRLSPPPRRCEALCPTHDLFAQCPIGEPALIMKRPLIGVAGNAIFTAASYGTYLVLFRFPLLRPVSTGSGESQSKIEFPGCCDGLLLAAMSCLSYLRSLAYHTACVSFIRFFKSAIFVSRFLSSSLRLALSFCSLFFSSIVTCELYTYSTIRALECLSRTSSVETFSSSLARYRSFNSVPPYIDTGFSFGLSIDTYMARPLHMTLVGSYLLLIDA